MGHSRLPPIMLSYINHISDPKHPTLVLLHGYGSNKEDLYGLKPYLPELNIVCFQAPISLGMGGYAWYPIEWENGAKMIDGDAVEEAAQLVLESLKTWQEQHVESTRCLLVDFPKGRSHHFKFYYKDSRQRGSF